MATQLPAVEGQQPAYRCWAEVDLDALRENLAWIRHRVGDRVRIMTVVKADAYGHGLRPIAAHLMRCGTDVFGVANLEEARSVRRTGHGWPILMLGACLREEMEVAIRDRVQVTVSDSGSARLLSELTGRLKRAAGVHLKVDTGMGRLGVDWREAVALVREILALPGLELRGVYTHFSAAEDDPRFTAKQRQRLRGVLREMRAAGVMLPEVHACNSAGLLHERSAWLDLVRPGLLVYGVVPSGSRPVPAAWKTRFRPALSLRARLSAVRDLPRAATISYCHTYTTPRRMRVGVVSAGYGDGYPLAGSGLANVLVRGQLCPVLGRVTMDQTVIDLSGLAATAAAGDEVVLLGRQGEQEITAGDLAGWCGTIPWDILTGISYRVPRVYRGVSAS